MFLEEPRKEIFRTNVGDGVRLNPLPGFTENREYEIIDEQFCPDRRDGMLYCVVNDKDKYCKVHSMYFTMPEVELFKETKPSDAASCNSERAMRFPSWNNIKEEDCWTMETVKPAKSIKASKATSFDDIDWVAKFETRPTSTQPKSTHNNWNGPVKPNKKEGIQWGYTFIDDLVYENLAHVPNPDIRKEHANENDLGFAKVVTLEEKVTAGNKKHSEQLDLQILSGIRKVDNKTNSFKSMEQAIERLSSQIAGLQSIKEQMQLELEMLKRISVLDIE